MIDLNEFESNFTRRVGVYALLQVVGLVRELRAARAVVDEARQYHNQHPTVISSEECRLCRALAAYEDVVKEQN